MSMEFEAAVDRIKDMAEHLVPYNYPLNDPSLSDDIEPLKCTVCFVDGYYVEINFTRQDYGDFYLEVCQLYNRNGAFLPFRLVAKIARKFLGGHNLHLLEMYRSGKKIYCWTVKLDKTGKPLSSITKRKNREKCNYEGFEYFYLHPTEINLH